jgi:hypothetical protein
MKRSGRPSNGTRLARSEVVLLAVVTTVIAAGVILLARL